MWFGNRRCFPGSLVNNSLTFTTFTLHLEASFSSKCGLVCTVSHLSQLEQSFSGGGIIVWLLSTHYTSSDWLKVLPTLTLSAGSNLVWLFQVSFSDGITILFFDWLSNSVDVWHFYAANWGSVTSSHAATQFSNCIATPSKSNWDFLDTANSSRSVFHRLISHFLSNLH